MLPFQDYIADPENLLPYNGIAHYHGKLFPHEESIHLCQTLFESIPWENDVVHMFGKRIVTKRKVAWYGDEAYAYKYSNSTKHALSWTKELLLIKQQIETVSKETYNSCLLNLYHEGEEGMGWHSDDEKELKPNGAIASISLGAERKFSFKHRETKETKSVLLEHGSLLVMKGEIQTHWLHALPKTKKVKEGRINLTFRTILK